jgi:hypothetical protein
MSTTFPDESQNLGAYNRQQKNVNPLLPNKFTFFLTKLPELSLASKSVNIPGVSLPSWKQTTSLNPIPRSGLNLEFQPLEITFIVDEDLNNWSELSNWMRLMAMVKSGADYGSVKIEQLQPGPEGGLVSDAQLVILTNESVPNIVFYFRDAFPVYLSDLQLSNDTSNPVPLEATVRFEYTYYDFETVNPTLEPDSGPPITDTRCV